MPGARLPMRKIRDMLRLTAAGMSSRKIAASLSIGGTTVVDCLQRARAVGVGWPQRQGFRLLICAMNDGGYGSEFHKLRADGIDDGLAMFGRPAFENIARGFGLRGHEIRDVSVIPKLFADFAAQGESEMWNIQISDQVTAPVIRQTIKRGHGNM